MDEGFDQADRLAQILNKHENVTLCCGHMHTAIFTSWHKIPCVTCPPIAMQMEVDFRGKNDINLTEEEKKEQAALRKEYIATIRMNLRTQLDNIDIKEQDGSITNLGEKYGNKASH